MSMHAFPLLFLNLGGEMMYILDQRLMAQNIPEDKAKKVLNDIVSTMLNKRFMEELFKPQELYAKRALRSVFDKLAHTSIMRLNKASMDKLYDLMSMAFKYQVYMCAQPSDLLLITLNHIDGIREMVTSASILQQVFDVYSLIIKNYGTMKHGSFVLIRQTLLNYFQDNHVRVSIFLRDKVQLPNGRFVMPLKLSLPYEYEIPGKIKFFDMEGKLASTTEFGSGGSYKCSNKKGSLDYLGVRGVNLGTNMYTSARSAVEAPKEELMPEAPAGSLSPVEKETHDEYARHELNLLADLLGSVSTEDKINEFRLNLFGTEDNVSSHETPQSAPEQNVIDIDASLSPSNIALAKIIGEMSVDNADNPDTDENLLDLMDLASNS